MDKLIEWTLDDITGEVQRISLVTEPAMESDFMLFKEAELKFKVTNEDKRIVTGVAMRPNIKIARLDENEELYYGYFSEETVVKACELYFKKGQNTNDTNLEHKYEVSDVFVFESWIVYDPKIDKTKTLGLSDIRAGDWVVSMKVDNDAVWEDFLKSGILKGFSVEIKATATPVDETQQVFNHLLELFNSEMSDEEIYEAIKIKIAEVVKD
jgi:hypothetical protein